MIILTHLGAFMVDGFFGIIFMALLTANRNAEDEHKDCWRDR